MAGIIHLPRTSRRRSTPLRRILLAAITAVLTFVAYAVVSEFVSNRTIDAQVARLTAGNAKLSQSIADHKAELLASQTTPWLEDQARQLGFVFPGETIYVVDAAASLPPDGGLAIKSLPTYNPTPSPTPSGSATPSPSADPAQGLSSSPTPQGFVLPTPAAHH